jgi:cellulose synthase/poly-beta-1,6-N-acetylglucosamine synthase-like glycosyltransferase
VNTLAVAAILGGALGATLACAAAYVLWLARARPGAAPRDDADTECPPLDVIVAVFNERRLLPGKLENLSRLVYPGGRLRFIIVDGASTDGTRELALAWARRDARFQVLATAGPGKAVQLNLGLGHAQAPWIVVTDVDARMRADTLWRLMVAVAREPALGLVGSPVMPVNVHPAEQMYWRLLNWLRLHEWRRGSASMVMAPCYAFRRSLIDRLPENVVSDDVHVAWRIGSLGYAIGLAGPVVHEVRGPATARGLFRQKCRRGAAILREVLRFVPGAGGMTPSLRAAFLARTACFIVGPLTVLTAAGLACLLLVQLPALEAGAALALVAGLGSLIMHPPDSSRVRKPLALITLLTLAATACVVLYPFFGRTGSFDAPPAWPRLKRL